MLTLLPLITIALIAISILILVHEFGHFLAAKLSGIWVEEFGIGLPPRVWGKKIGETIYSVNWLPVGGFVRLHGEDPDSKVTRPKQSFQNKSPLTRSFIAVAGVFMNFILAIIAFTIIYWFTGIPQGVKILEVNPESPAAVAGLEANDEILELDGQQIKDYLNFTELIAQKIGQSVQIKLQRDTNGQQIQKTTTAIIRSTFPEDQGPLGIIYTPREIYYPPLWQRPFVFSYYGTTKTIDISEKIIQGFAIIFSQLFGGQIPKGVAGPVGVTALLAEIAKMGILPVVEFMGIISINLALINLIPFPPLDGSRVVFITAETIFGKRLTPKLESWSYTVGMALLLLLVLALTAREIPKLLTAGSLSNFVDLILQ
jgi:regulator of sigma E protease